MAHLDDPSQLSPIPHNDREPQTACPTCGHTPAPYAQRASGLLDTLLLLEAVVADLKKAAEEVAL